MTDANELLIARPICLVHVEGGIVLKRGCTEMVVMGEAAGELVKSILNRAAGDGVTREQLRSEAGIEAAAATDQLIDALLARRLLSPVVSDQRSMTEREGPEDVYYWHYETTKPEVADRLGDASILIVGQNIVSSAVCRSLAASGVNRITILDEPTVSNEGYVPDSQPLNLPLATTVSVIHPTAFDPDVSQSSSQYVVVTSDHGAQECMREWNAKCLRAGWRFFPVVLHNLLGYVGPLSIPGQTPCYECLRARQNSHLCDAALQRAAERDSHSIAAYHPSMGEIVGNLAGLQLAGFISRFGPARAGSLTTVNFITSEMLTRRVLKVPRCSGCSRLNQHATITPLKSVFMPGNMQ